MTPYVLGYAFFRDSLGAPHVFMIRKNRPTWMAGMWNGIGGHIESGETAVEAMRREFREEAGLDVANWTPLVHLVAGNSASIHIFSAEVPMEAARAYQSLTDEMVMPFFLEFLPENVVPNVRWQVHMAALTYTNPDYTVLGYPHIRTGKAESVAEAA